MTGAGPMISVVIPTYNRMDHLRRSLDSLVEQLPIGALEVVVSDDGSSDGTRDVCRSFAGRLRLRYHFQEDRGYRVATARNAGARLATAPILAFLDSGAVAGPQFAAAHLSHHACVEPASARGAAVVGYTYAYDFAGAPPAVRELLAGPAPRDIVARLGDAPQLRDSRHGELEPVGFDLGRVAAPWRFFWTVNVSLRAADFWAVGGFDEEFTGWGAEDLELGYRLHHAGVAMTMSRRAWALETPHERDVVGNLASNIRNLVRFQAKHDGPETELFCVCRRDRVPVQQAFEDLARWRAGTRHLDVRAELTALGGDRPARYGAGRIAVIGCGTAVPEGWPPCTVLDFDADVLEKAATGTRHRGHHAIGLRTLLSDGSFDMVLVSSRLSGLWHRWGPQLIAEAHRLGREVRTYHELPAWR